MLRHLTGLVIGLLAAPLLWAGAAWSADRLLPVTGSPGIGDPGVLGPFGALLGTGVLAGILAATRVSPLASFLSGLALTSFVVWPLVHAGSADRMLPQAGIAEGSLFHPVGPALPIGLVLGVLLLFAAFPPSRWRARRDDTPVASPYRPAPYEPAYEPPAETTPGPGWRTDDTDPEPADAPGFRYAGSGDPGGASTTTPFERRPGGHDREP